MKPARFAVVALLTGAHLLAAERADQALMASSIGPIVGAEYDRAGGLSLYAAPPDPSGASTLFVDDVLTMASAAFRVGSFSFSLETKRLAAAPFRPTDVLDPGGLATYLRTGTEPLAAYVREHLDREASSLIRRYATSLEPAREARLLLDALPRLLNRLRATADLYGPDRFPGGLSVDAAGALASDHGSTDRMRFNRLILEDALAAYIQPSIDTNYEIRYFGADLDDEKFLAALFRNTVTEYTFAKTDYWLKHASRCEVDEQVLSGPCSLVMGGKEIEDSLRTHPEAKPQFGEHVLFFEMLAPPRFDDRRLFFDSPTLAVRAASRRANQAAPISMQLLAQNASQALGRLYAEPTTAEETRRLRNILLIGRSFGWARSMGIRPSAQALNCWEPTQRKSPPPIPIRSDNLVVSEPGSPLRILSFQLRGGILGADDDGDASWQALIRGPRSLPSASSDRACTSARTPPKAFTISTVSIDGRELIRIVLNTTLGL